MDSQHAGAGYLALPEVSRGPGILVRCTTGGQEIDMADARSALLGHDAEEDRSEHDPDATDLAWRRTLAFPPAPR